MIASQIAVVAYGAITILLAFAFGCVQGSAWGMALALLAAGFTYLFQVIDAALGPDDTAEFSNVILGSLWATVAVLIIASGLTSLIFGG